MGSEAVGARAESGVPELALIGGCGSSGTTLLAHLLSRHSAVASTPEIDFFNHPEVLRLTSLRQHLDALYRKGRPLCGYKLFSSFLHHVDDLGLDRASFEQMLARTSSSRELFLALARQITRQAGAICFVEQTPTNVYLFPEFTAHYPEFKLIHPIRDGRDVATSFMRRGKSLYYAGSRWLYDTLAGLQVRGSPSYLEIHYEELARQPVPTLTAVVRHLGLDFEEAMLEAPAKEAKAAAEPDRDDASRAVYEEDWRGRRAPRNWTHVPDGPISTSSIGRFREQLSARQLSTLYRIRLTREARSRLDAPVDGFAELLEYLGYDLAEPRPAAVTLDLRARETLAQLSDGVRRGLLGLRRAGTPGRPLTTLDAQPRAAPSDRG